MEKILFTAGPVMMFPETLAVGGEQVPYFRNDWFSALILDLEKDLLGFVSAPSGSRAIFITGSGTAAMEAAVLNFIDAKSKPAVINGGTFGHRFTNILRCHGHDVQEITVDRDPLTDGKVLSQFDDNTTTLFVTAHETSVGHCYDIAATGAFCASRNCLHIVDAISMFATDPLDMSENNIDVLIISSNKGMAAAPGISMLVLSPHALGKIIDNPGTFYFNVSSMLKDGLRGQTNFTPAVSTLMQMKQRFNMLRGGGLEHAICHAGSLSKYFRSKIDELPLQQHTKYCPNAMTSLEIVSNKIDARTLVSRLEDTFGLVLSPPSLCPSGSALVRVGHMGNISFDDIDRLLNAFREIFHSSGRSL